MRGIREGLRGRPQVPRAYTIETQLEVRSLSQTIYFSRGRPGHQLPSPAA
jgi:hypothetical protein